MCGGGGGGGNDRAQQRRHEEQMQFQRDAAASPGSLWSLGLLAPFSATALVNLSSVAASSGCTCKRHEERSSSIRRF